MQVKRVLLRMPYSGHPDDWFLNVVLCETLTGEFVTWTENLQSGGFAHGHYFENLVDAIDDFPKRVRRSFPPAEYSLPVDCESPADLNLKRAQELLNRSEHIPSRKTAHEITNTILRELHQADCEELRSALPDSYAILDGTRTRHM